MSLFGKILYTVFPRTNFFFFFFEQNYGPYFDTIESGLPGPVELIGRKGDESVIKDLSSHKWSYEVGLHGFDNKLYSSDSRYASKWEAENLPTNRMMTRIQMVIQLLNLHD